MPASTYKIWGAVGSLLKDGVSGSVHLGVATVPDRPPSRDHIKPRSKGQALAGNLALVCCRCNHDKGSRTLGQWLTRLSRAGDPCADHVEAFMRTSRVELDFVKR